MFKSGVSAQTQKNLVKLAKLDFVKKYYLAGGTGIALQIGHRLSYDLDFFCQKPVRPAEIMTELKDKGKIKVFQNDQGTFNGVFNGVKLSFFIYPYKNIFKLKEYEGVKLADLRDIGCMKLDAIGSRGTKRDFIDLYFICKKYSLDELFSWLKKKYQEVELSLVHIARSLVYFKDADDQEMPKMLKPVDWEEVKGYFINEVRRLSKKWFI